MKHFSLLLLTVQSWLVLVFTLNPNWILTFRLHKVDLFNFNFIIIYDKEIFFYVYLFVCNYFDEYWKVKVPIQWNTQWIHESLWSCSNEHLLAVTALGYRFPHNLHRLFEWRNSTDRWKLGAEKLLSLLHLNRFIQFCVSI